MRVADRLRTGRRGLITLLALATFGIGGSILNKEDPIDCSLPELPEIGYQGDLKDKYTFDPEIEKQLKDASPELKDLLHCMDKHLSPTQGRIGSISDSEGFKHCQNDYGPECAHAKNSAHYGCKDKYSGSLAVDFGDEQHACDLVSAAKKCGAKKALGPRREVAKCGSDFFQADGNHEICVHISVRPKSSHYSCN